MPKHKDRDLRNNSDHFANLSVRRKLFELQFTGSCGKPRSPSDRSFYIGLDTDA